MTKRVFMETIKKLPPKLSQFTIKTNERLLVRRTIKILADWVNHEDVEMCAFAELLCDWEELEWQRQRK